jgi:hypothetical protein
MAAGALSGLVMIRPVRMAMLVEADLNQLRQAATWALSAWGGMYSLVLDPAGGHSVLSIAAGLGVDALFPVSNSPLAAALAESPGYRWLGGPGWGPFDPPREHLSSRLLGTDWLLARLGVDDRVLLPRWSESDALADLFSIWLGEFGQSEYDRRLEAAVAAKAELVTIEPGGPVALPDGITPISLTGREISYTGDSYFHGFVVLDPSDPAALRDFWNLRAAGGSVFPWPLGHTTRLFETAKAWTARMRAAGAFSGWRRGDGTPLPPHARVLFPDGASSVPADLAALLDELEVVSMPDAYGDSRGWHGIHPMGTEYKRTFSVDVDGGASAAGIALPEFSSDVKRDALSGSMIVAAQIEVFREHGLGPTQWATIPNIRALADVLTALPPIVTLRRPVSRGRVLGIPVQSEQCFIDILPAMRVVAKLFEGSGWDCSQSDNGRFAGRLADILDGPGATTACEPAVREVLASTVRSPVGKSLKELQSTAERNRGAWPRGLAALRGTDRYVDGVVLRLLHKKLLRPHLSVRCPDCAIPTSLRPEDLGTTLTCEMCSASFPLGFALALQRKTRSGWHYRLPSDIGADRLLEALALIATAGALTFDSANEANPHQFGVKLSSPRTTRATRGQSCEMDILMSLENGGQPEFIVGEVKGAGHLEDDDLRNLIKVQGWFLSQGFNCVPLFATLRDSLTPDEQHLLRTACDQAREYLGSQVLPLMPVVLLKRDLSTAPLEQDHPRSWPGPGASVAELAVASAKRNLGLLDVSWGPASGGGGGWQCQWQ